MYWINAFTIAVAFICPVVYVVLFRRLHRRWERRMDELDEMLDLTIKLRERNEATLRAALRNIGQEHLLN